MAYLDAVTAMVGEDRMCIHYECTVRHFGNCWAKTSAGSRGVRGKKDREHAVTTFKALRPNALALEGFRFRQLSRSVVPIANKSQANHCLCLLFEKRAVSLI